MPWAMLASYWMVAGQYAFRYAHPEEYRDSELFFAGQPQRRKLAAEQPEDVKVLMPERER